MPEALDDRPRELLIAGHVNVDCFFRIRAFPKDDRTVPVVQSHAELGGTAANLAVVATRLGVRSGLFAYLGEGFPAEFSARLERSGIDLRGVTTLPDRRTPTCYTMIDGRGHQRTLIDQGAMGPSGGPLPTPALLEEYSWLHVATGPPEVYLKLVAAARRAGLRVAADPAQEIHYRWDRRRFAALLAESEVLFGNRSEIRRAATLVGLRGPVELLERVPLVVRTEGASGVTAFSRRGELHVRAASARRVRTVVGAGDAFRGGFYSGWFAGQPLEHCLEAGVRSAARWVERPGG